MTPENLPDENIDKDHCAAGHMKSIVSDYELPESYQRLVNGPWRLVAQAVIDQYGDESDAWGRMTWFTRILCTAIESSLERNNPEPVKDALNGFSIWLNSLRDDGDAHSMCVSAANYAQRRISTQITEDTCEELPADTDQDDTPRQEPAAQASESIADDPREETSLTDNVETDGDEAPVKEAPCQAEQPTPAETADAAESKMPLSGQLTATPEASQPTPAQEDDGLETLSLSLAYSAGKPVTEPTPTEAQEALPEHTKRGTDMDISSPNAVSEKTVNPAETSPSTAAETPASNGQLTQPSSIAPVPMDTWLAFHDQDNPTLARLALFDPATDKFMLANKNGILVRQIGKSDLLNLVNNGMIQMVEFRPISQ